MGYHAVDAFFDDAPRPTAKRAPVIPRRRTSHEHEASERTFIWTMCEGKRRYRDRDEATRVRHLRTKAAGTPLRIYDCDFCKGFHLTSRMSTTDLLTWSTARVRQT